MRTKKLIIAFGACAALVVAPVAAEAHSYTASSSVTIAPKFRGKVRSGKPFCRRGRTVSLWKARRGADRKVGSDRTNNRGGWSIRKPNARGRYYARVSFKSGKSYGHNHRCASDRSRTIRVG